MRNNINNSGRFLCGVMDLAIETRFLAVVRHPNIIKMRAISSINPSQKHYFILLDRLYDTLTDRITAWKKKKAAMQGLQKIRDLKGDKKKRLFLDRLIVAYDLCSALNYLHRLNIVYRDLVSLIESVNKLSIP